MKARLVRFASSFVFATIMVAPTGGLIQGQTPDTRTASTAQVAENMLQGFRYRMIGPHRGGRVTAVAGVPGDHRTFYMGATGGGVWKTTDAGEVWENISDRYFRVGSVGAIAVAPVGSQGNLSGHRICEYPKQYRDRPWLLQIHRCRSHLVRSLYLCQPQ